MFKRLAVLSLALAAAAVSVPAAAQFAKPEDAVKYRQSALSVMGTHFGRLGAMANGRVPFDAKAKPEIWKEAAKFKEHGDKMIAETTKLAAAAKVGNIDALKAAFGPAAATCKACHDAFKNN
jgi:cytochrome c556